MKRVRRILIALLLGLIVACVGLWLYIRPAPNHNSLNLGKADMPPLTIKLVPPMEFDGMTRDQIYELRRRAVAHYPELLAHDYEPSDVVFGQLVDGKPWWGNAGLMYYGSGEMSSEGLSEHSRFVLNPFLLVGITFMGWDVGGIPERSHWDTRRITPEVIASNEFPPTCLAQDLHWDAANRAADVTYDVTACLAEINRWTSTPVTMGDGFMEVIAYNARDFNLNWIYVWYPMPGATYFDDFDRPIKIPQFLHPGPSCGFPGKCNNMSPWEPLLGSYFNYGPPVTFTVYLWKDEPDSRRSTPDMTFKIFLK